MKRLLLAGLLTLAVAPPVSFADDIWARRDPRMANLFQDNRARNVGDIVTLIINENTVENEREQRQQSKTNNFTGQATLFGVPQVAGSNGNFGRNFTGNGQFTGGRTFLDRIALTVVDVMPNGNLVVEGFRSRLTMGEERVLRVSGVVRPQDITVGNVVTSASLANARLSYLGRGPTSRQLNQNFFGRVMNRIWPF
ncbi:MAG: flagellar basal body L-ring protein FlgH [Fimbriiglobus sp.]|jgi:flagellar L-ring protein precursor FlgH|nr:flagellar basal body L-ring protein FlgH [Fimbriiglobus sp.]